MPTAYTEAPGDASRFGSAPVPILGRSPWGMYQKKSAAARTDRLEQRRDKRRNQRKLLDPRHLRRRQAYIVMAYGSMRDTCGGDSVGIAKQMRVRLSLGSGSWR